MVGLDVQALVSSRPGCAGWRPLRSLRWWRQSQHAGDIAAELSLCAIERARAVDNSSLPTGGAGTLAGGSAPVPAPTGPTVSPPSTIAANCSVDVSKPLRKWLKALPAGSTVVAPTNECYLVDQGLNLKDPKNLTIYGGTFADKATSAAGVHPFGNPVFSVVGGSGLSIEAMHIVGANAGGYHPKLAFASDHFERIR
jgi:hypothetical protein